MAVYVILEVEDDEQAKTLCADIVAYPGARLLTPSQENDVAVRLAGVFKKPTLYCDPTDGHRGGGKTQAGWRRGIKYGWWVCASCGKPSRGWAMGNHWHSAVGTDLLPKEISGDRYRPTGWTSPLQWDFLLEYLPEENER
jgi:hypothetical protein